MATDRDLSTEKHKQILAEWKKLYTEALIDALHPAGDVLLVGFGNPETAERIHSFKPKSLVIIESNPNIIPQMESWAKSKPGIVTITQKWEKSLHELGLFDSVFFNADSYSDDEMIHGLFPVNVELAKSQVQQPLKELKDEITNVTASFSEKDIENFYETAGKFNLDELSEFFRLLKENKNISEELYQKTVKKYQLDKPQKPKQTKNVIASPSDSVLAFLQTCLKDHMRKGSKFTAFLKTQLSKYRDAAFFESIITNPALTYREETIPLKMSDQERKVILMTVEKSA